jgi:hypothetical protein
MLSTLEGFSIDPKIAFTGDITVDWKVRTIGGVPEKLRGAAAAKCLYAAIPAGNTSQFGDAGLLYGRSAYWDLQVFAVETVQQAAALARTDREPKLAEAMKRFAELQAELTKSERLALQKPETKATLKQVLELAPNHLSAKLVLALAENSAPKTLTPAASDQQLFLAYIPYLEIISSGKQFDRTTITPAITTTTRRRLDTLRPIIDPGYRPMLVESSAFIETLDGYVSGRVPFATLKSKIDALQARAKLSSDPNVIERRINGG